MHDLDYLEPPSVAEASRIAADLGDSARFMAGGTALMLALRQRMLQPSHLVSLFRLAPLRGIEVDAQGALRLGALSLHHEVAASPIVRQHSAMLSDMAARVANPQVRNQGTLGGNLCYADPSTDPPGCLLALDARVVLASHRGVRELPMGDFLVDYFTTAIEPDELLQTIVVPAWMPGTKGRYDRFLRTAAEHRPMVNVAAVANLEGGVCVQARIVIGAAVAVTQRVGAAEDCLLGHAPSWERIEAAANAAMSSITPLDDLRGSADYRRDMVGVQVRRTLAQLFNLTRN
jgi:carbon-monoxide dehydrogenase medium subunit